MNQVLLTGPVNSGKTTACDKLREIARANRWKVGGVTIEKELDENGKVETLILKDLMAGNRVEVGRPAVEGEELPEGWFKFHKWIFHREAFIWGNMLLSRPAPMDLIIIDEVGPLEMEGTGFAPAVWGVRAPRMLYVARSGMAKHLQPNLARGNFSLVELTEENRDDIPKKLANILELTDR